MNWDQIVQYILRFVTSAGGAGVIILGTSTFLGKVWAKYFIELEKARLNEALEQIRSSYARELELYKAGINLSISKLERFSLRQFETYSTIWASLYDLRTVADKLWEHATGDSLRDFRQQLELTTATVYRNSIFIRDDHYVALNHLFQTFLQFQTGKGALIAVRSDPKFPIAFSRRIVQQQIESNRVHKDKYVALVDTMRKYFVAMLAGPVDHLDSIQAPPAAANGT